MLRSAAAIFGVVCLLASTPATARADSIEVGLSPDGTLRHCGTSAVQAAQAHERISSVTDGDLSTGTLAALVPAHGYALDPRGSPGTCAAEPASHETAVLAPLDVHFGCRAGTRALHTLPTRESPDLDLGEVFPTEVGSPGAVIRDRTRNSGRSVIPRPDSARPGEGTDAFLHVMQALGRGSLTIGAETGDTARGTGDPSGHMPAPDAFPVGWFELTVIAAAVAIGRRRRRRRPA